MLLRIGLFLVLGIWVKIGLGQPTSALFQTPSLLRVVDSLEARLLALGEKEEVQLPPVFIDPQLTSNARFVRDTIFLGPLQRDFHSFGDSMSIIYHEYLHKVFWEQQRYPFQFDSTGKPIQWETGSFYTYEPHPGQTVRDLENLRQYYARVEPELVGEALKTRLEMMKEVLRQPQSLPFVYAPSNLALEELAAYQGQLAGEKLGLYRLSESGRNSVGFRMYQLKQTLELRKAYEAEHGLGPDGGRLNPVNN